MSASWTTLSGVAELPRPDPDRDHRHAIVLRIPALRAVALRRRPGPVEALVCDARRIGLAGTLSYRPPTSRPVNRDGGPPVAVLVAEVDQQCVLVVLDAQPMARVRGLVQSSYCFRRRELGVGDKGGPPLSALLRGHGRILPEECPDQLAVFGSSTTYALREQSWASVTVSSAALANHQMRRRTSDRSAAATRRPRSAPSARRCA
jgi:hypothetical protein